MNRIRRTRVEDYLGAIYEISRTEGVDRVSTGRIAQHLGVAGGTASSMIKQLAADGLVEHLAYAGASLTSKGRQRARHALRRQRLLEMFLAKTMGFAEVAAAEEAWLLEPAASERLIERVDRFLQHPALDS